MTVETGLQEIAELNADIFEKDIKELSDSEKAQIVRELTKYSLSDSFFELCKAIKTDLAPKYESKAEKKLKYSQLQRDVLTKDFMEKIVHLVDDSTG